MYVHRYCRAENCRRRTNFAIFPPLVKNIFLQIFLCSGAKPTFPIGNPRNATMSCILILANLQNLSPARVSDYTVLMSFSLSLSVCRDYAPSRSEVIACLVSKLHVNLHYMCTYTVYLQVQAF